MGYAFTYIALLGSALGVTWAMGGRQAVIRFLSRYLIWRFGARRWALVVLALPALTVAVAAASGTLHVAATAGPTSPARSCCRPSSPAPSR